jgi:hypothetical protein
MSPKLPQSAIDHLRDIRTATPHGGAHMHPSGQWFCTGPMTVKSFKLLAAAKLINVIDARIVITPAGLDFLEGVP